MSPSSEQLIQLGREAYRKREYDAAYQKFMDALSMVGRPSIDLLDCIAATAEKKDSFQASLMYGRQMIEVDERNARGYLRVGHILQGRKTDGHRKAAMAIYERGIRKVDHSDPNFELLQTVLDKVRRNIYPAAVCDPLSTLPVEVVEIVLGNLEFHQVVACLRVSQSWKAYLSSSPRLWTTINLDTVSIKAQRRITPQAVKNYIRNSQYTLHTAKLGCFPHRSTLLALVKSCKALNHLEFANGSDLGGESVIEAVRDAKALKVLTVGICLAPTQALEILRDTATMSEVNLTNISMGRIPGVNLGRESLQLTTLTLYGMSISFDASSEEMFTQCPNLRTLKLSGVIFYRAMNISALTSLTCLALKKCQFTWGLFLPPTITHLKLEWCSNRPGTPDFQAFTTLPALQELFIYHHSWHRSQDLLLWLLYPLESSKMNLSHHAKRGNSELSDLRSLTIGTQSLGDSYASMRNPRLFKLEHLNLWFPGFSDEMLRSVTEPYTNLSSVHLAACDVTGVGIKELVINHPGLKYLELEKCEKISPDALEWAESLGVRVTKRVQFSASKNIRASDSGRRVRYG